MTLNHQKKPQKRKAMERNKPLPFLMFKIGNVDIKGRVVLAPMAGVTSFAYRLFMAPFGLDLTVTEMISDCGIIYGNEETLKYLPQKGDPRPIALQLFGGEKDNLVAAIKKIETMEQVEFDILDLNLGCPVPKVTRNNGGSAWLKDEQRLVEMLEAVVATSSRPVTVKIRIGWDEDSINFLELIPKIEKSGVKMIAVHFRTTKQLYGGKARYELGNNLRAKMTVPLVVSGDIFTLEDAISALEITGADAVMVARGSMGNPHLIKQISHYYQTGEKLEAVSLKDQISYLRQFARLLVEEKGEKTAISNLRGIASHFLSGFPHTKQYRIKISQTMTCLADLDAILDEIDNSNLF